MLSPRASQFRGGGGILRRKDGTVLDIQFSDKNPLFKDDKPRPAAKDGKKAFHSLYAVLTIQEDGREEATQQPLFVGDADQFEVVCEGRGLSGDGALSKSSDFFIFLDSLSHPTDGGDGFPEENFPEDPDGLVADFSAMRGARVMFDWKKNDAKTKKLGQRTVKGKGGKPDMKFDREDLVVAVYYGQTDVDAADAPKVNKPASSKPAAGKPAAGKAKTTTAAAAPAVNVAETAAVKVAECVAAAKDQKLTINKLSVKLLQAMSADPADVREEVRAWALKGDNLKGISNDYAPDGKEFSYDPASQTLSLVDEV